MCTVVTHQQNKHKSSFITQSRSMMQELMGRKKKINVFKLAFSCRFNEYIPLETWKSILDTLKNQAEFCCRLTVLSYAEGAYDVLSRLLYTEIAKHRTLNVKSGIDHAGFTTHYSALGGSILPCSTEPSCYWGFLLCKRQIYCST